MKGRYQEPAAFEWLFEQAFGSVMQPNQSQPDLFLESFVTMGKPHRWVMLLEVQLVSFQRSTCMVKILSEMSSKLSSQSAKKFVEMLYWYCKELGGGFKYVLFSSLLGWGNDPTWLIFFKWVETTNQRRSNRIYHSLFYPLVHWSSFALVYSRVASCWKHRQNSLAYDA